MVRRQVQESGVLCVVLCGLLNRAVNVRLSEYFHQPLVIDTELVGQMTIVSDLKKTFTETIPSYFRTEPDQSSPSSTSHSNLPVVRQDPEEVYQLRNSINQQEAQLQQIKAELSRVTQENDHISRHYSKLQSHCNEWEADARRFHDELAEERTAKEHAVSSSNTLRERYSTMRD